MSSRSLHTNIMYLMLVTLIRLLDITNIVWLLWLFITYKALLLTSSVGFLELRLLVLHQPWLLDHLLLPNTVRLTKMWGDNARLILSHSRYGSTNLRM